jgi:4a-hydroxytetrahydrobiopterin dehydratase
MEKLTERTIEERLDKLEGWEYVDGAIEASFKFKDFRETFAVMTKIAFECEVQNHHPDWRNVYNNLHIRLNTHDAGGITEKDFKLAHAIWDIIHRSEQ